MSESRERGTEIIYPRGRRPHRPGSRTAQPFLAPLSWIYGVSIRCLRRRALGTSVQRSSGATVISIGNIEIGGTGKTPFAIYLIEQLKKAGQTPLYLSRGYRSVAEHLNAVTIVPPRNPDSCPALVSGARLLNREHRSLHREIGDEGAVVARRLPEVPLLFTKNKKRAIAVARELFSPTHIVLDDAFQSWGLSRDIDIVLLDPRAPFGNGRLLPAGTLREEPSALKRAHLVGCLGEVKPVAARLVEEARSVNASPGTLFTGRRQITFLDSTGAPVPPPPDPVAALSAIARPDRFEALLGEHGCDVTCSLRYPDHYRYTPEDCGYIQNMLASKSVSTVVMTEKDWVKLDGYDLGPIAHLVTRLELVIDGIDLIDAIQKPRPGAAVSV